MGFDDPLCNRQTQATTSFILTTGLIATIKPVEYRRKSLCWYANSCVNDGKLSDVAATHEQFEQDDQIVKFGIPAVPPSETDNVIIANIAPSKVGKKYSSADMEKLAGGKPVTVKIDKDKVFDLLIPTTDAKGATSAAGSL